MRQRTANYIKRLPATYQRYLRTRAGKIYRAKHDITGNAYQKIYFSILKTTVNKELKMQHDNEILQKAINTFGNKKQIIKTLEELNELGFENYEVR